MSTTAQAQALFASFLQPSDRPTPRQVAAAVHESLPRNGGAAGCAQAVASEYGDHPETAPARMRWAMTLVVQTERGLTAVA